MKHFLGIILALVFTVAFFEQANAQLYVASSQDGTILEYDVATGALINKALVSGLRKPHGLAYSDGALYVTDYATGTIGKYDAKTGAAINRALVTGVFSPQAVAISGNVLYVTGLDGQGTGMVAKYDALTGAPISPSFIVRLKTPLGVAVSGNRLYVVCYGGGRGSVGQYDATTGAPIQEALIPHIPNANGLALSGDYLWLVLSINSPSGSVGRFDANTGNNASGYRRPLVSGLNYPTTVAVSGDDLYVASYSDGTVGKYNASTGAVINASFVNGLQASVTGIAVVPTAVSSSAQTSDWLVSVMETPWYFWVAGGLVLGGLFVLLFFVALLFLKRKKSPTIEPSLPAKPRPPGTPKPPVAPLPPGAPAPSVIPPSPVAAAPSEPSSNSDLKLVIICLVVVAMLGVGSYMTYEIAMSYYIARTFEAGSRVHAEAAADAQRKQDAALPPPMPYVPPTLQTAPAILVDPDHLVTENNWLAAMIARRMASLAHLALHRDETSVPDLKIQANVKADDRTVHLEISGFANDPVVIDLKPDFAWDSAGYAPLAAKLLGSTPAESGAAGEALPDELTTLLDLTAPNLAREDVTLSTLLQKHPAWPELHEQAALLLVAMALRDQAREYSDSRPMLSRATAHLALAQVLRGSNPPTVAGEVADAGIRALSGREVDATARLDALQARTDLPDSAKTWITALRLRAKDDWRVATPDAKSPLLLKIAWFQTLNDNLTALGALKRLENLGDAEQVSDWAHAALANQVSRSVETDNEFCQSSMKLEIGELSQALQTENASPASTDSIGSVLADPLSEKLYVGSTPTLKIMGPEMFKNFANRHLLMEIEDSYYWLRDELGVPDDARKFMSEASDSFAGMRRMEELGLFTEGGTGNTQVILKEVAKHNTTWFPWELAHGELPGNPTLANVHPDVDTLNAFYQDGLPFGTVYNIINRPYTLSVATNFHRQLSAAAFNYNFPVYPYPKDLRALAPDYFSVYKLDKNDQSIFQDTKPWWDYNLASIVEAETKANTLDDDDYVTLLQKHAILNPDAWFKLGDHLRKEGKDDAAADADRKGFDQGYDQVGMSNSVGPLVDYYYDHDRKDDAEMVAKRAAEVYSCEGLTIYCKLLEKLGRFAEAEENAKAIADRYEDRSVLDELYSAHPDFFQAQNKILMDKAFPHGLQKVDFHSFSGPPTSGDQYTSDSPLLQEGSLQAGDIVVALDGYRVENDEQYVYIRALTSDPKMDLIIWRKDRYFEVHASPPNRRFEVETSTYTAPSN